MIDEHVVYSIKIVVEIKLTLIKNTIPSKNMYGTSDLYVINKDNQYHLKSTIFHCKNLSLCTRNSILVLTYLENTGELCSRYGLALGICKHSDHQVSALSQFHRTIY